MIRVGIYGNNLNQGYFLARLLRELGAEARVFLRAQAHEQDEHAWWTSAPVDESLVERIPKPIDVGRRGALTRDAGVVELYRRATRYDVLIVREEGPALFSELPEVPLVFAAQGADLQLWP
ncbi:MAG: hypothetical protein NZM12_08145, partial [Steroidobacteraceae bacterium]|nr:hypothetical protein [Steroidobacteraceae bacterium]